MVYYTLISLLVQVLVITSERFDLLLTDDLLYFSTPTSVQLNALTMAMVMVDARSSNHDISEGVPLPRTASCMKPYLVSNEDTHFPSLIKTIMQTRTYYRINNKERTSCFVSCWLACGSFDYLSFFPGVKLMDSGQDRVGL